MFEKDKIKKKDGKQNENVLPVKAEKLGLPVKAGRLTYSLKLQKPIPEGIKTTVARVCYTKPDKAKRLEPSWVIPNMNGKPEQVSVITGLIVANKTTRTLWDTSAGLGNPPLCASNDSIVPCTANPINPTCAGCPMRNPQVTPSIEKGKPDTVTVPCKYQMHLMFLPSTTISSGNFGISDLQGIMDAGYNPLRRMVEIVLTTTSVVKNYPGSITEFYNICETAQTPFPLVPVKLILTSEVSKQGFEYARVVVEPIGYIDCNEENENDPVFLEYSNYINAAVGYLQGRPVTSYEEYMQLHENQSELEGQEEK